MPELLIQAAIALTGHMCASSSSNLHKVNGLQPGYIKVRIHEFTTERNQHTKWRGLPGCEVNCNGFGLSWVDPDVLDSEVQRLVTAEEANER